MVLYMFLKMCVSPTGPLGPRWVLLLLLLLLLSLYLHDYDYYYMYASMPQAGGSAFLLSGAAVFRAKQVWAQDDRA